MERKVGTVSRGIRCPIIREGDNLADIVVNSVLEAGESEGFEIRDRDVISVTESVVARAQGTTPRRLTDLIGSLCDLTSGSGDKGTPIILVQGYFDNYTN